VIDLDKLAGVWAALTLVSVAFSLVLAFRAPISD